MKISGNIVDVHNRRIFPGVVEIKGETISDIIEQDADSSRFIMPGLSDAHIHIESSMVTPGAFACEAVRHGTTSVVSDPHEIANVLGLKGVLYMLDDSSKVPVKFNFGAPSCVPATSFESSGAQLGSRDVGKLLKMPEILYLSEMMNFPGVIFGDAEVIEKISVANSLKKPIDGHAPGLSGENLRKYVSAGISTDHECSTIDEAREKIELGMKVLIREGSAARNLQALKELYRESPSEVMLCSDDLHPEMLMNGHINSLVSRLVIDGYDLFDVLRSCTVNPARHYKLDAGLLRPGDKADIVVVDSLSRMKVLETWINGDLVFKDNTTLFSYYPGKGINNFNCSFITPDQLGILKQKGSVRVIEAEDGSLLTGESFFTPGSDEYVFPSPSTGINKIVVKERYHDSGPALGFVRGFGLHRGAFASSIAHDSHNIVAVGAGDDDLLAAINEVVRNKGGLALAEGGVVKSLKLDIGGIMTTRSCRDVAADYLNLTEAVRNLGCNMKAPFMSLSFMSLLVIPELKIGDRGLFDVTKFQPVSLFKA
jgi:adenine deaminase